MHPPVIFGFSRWLIAQTASRSVDQVIIETAFQPTDRFVTVQRFPLLSVQRFPLRSLDPLPKRGSHRLPDFAFGICLCLGGFWMAAVWLLSDGFKLGLKFPIIMALIGFVGMAWALRNVQPWNYASFFSNTGALAFTLRCPPSDQDKFDSFVNALAVQIQAANPTASETQRQSQPEG